MLSSLTGFFGGMPKGLHQSLETHRVFCIRLTIRKGSPRAQSSMVEADLAPD
jgi:hypothetical protein